MVIEKENGESLRHNANDIRRVSFEEGYEEGNETEAPEDENPTFRLIDYAALTTSPILSEATFTIPGGTTITASNPNPFILTLSEDLIFDKPEDGSDTAYLILSDEGVKRVAQTVELESNECIIAKINWGRYVYSGGFDSYYLNDKLVTLYGWNDSDVATGGQITDLDSRLASLEAQSYYLPDITQGTLPHFSTDHTLTIFGFGSSWFTQSWCYLDKMLKNAGIKFEIYMAYVGGASFDKWLSIYNTGILSGTKSDADNGRAFALYHASFDGTDFQPFSLVSGQTLENAMGLLDWDLFVFQQGADVGREWSAYLNYPELLYNIKSCIPTTTYIGYNASWCPGIHDGASTKYDMHPYESTPEGQKQWQQDAFNCQRKFLSLTGIYNFIPNGTLMWLLRHHYNDLDMTTDGYHLYRGLPTYAANAMFWETYIAPIYGISIKDVDYLPSRSDYAGAGSGWMEMSTAQKMEIYSLIKQSLAKKIIDL